MAVRKWKVGTKMVLHTKKPSPFIFPYIYRPQPATLGGLKPFSFALSLSEVCYSSAKMPCQPKSNTLSYSVLMFPHAVCAAGINELYASLCESVFCPSSLQSPSRTTSRGRGQDFPSQVLTPCSKNSANWTLLWTPDPKDSPTSTDGAFERQNKHEKAGLSARG